MQPRATSVEQAAENMGVLIDWCVLDSNRRAHEWFIPWRSVGKGGIAEGTRLASKMIAFSGGYNDKDTWDDDVCRIRWVGIDPWEPEAADTHPFGWGNLAIDDMMPPVGPQAAVRPPAVRRQPTATGDSRQYTLRGQALAKQPDMRGPAVIVGTSDIGRTSLSLRSSPGTR
jgi:hypothetical protein